MITLLIVAAISMNEYLDNLCHMNRTTGNHMPSLKDEIFTEISKYFSICWNFPNCVESIDASTSEFIARRTPAANILTTNSAIPVFCRLLWTQIWNLLTVDVAAYGKPSDGGVFRNSALYQSLETRSLQVPEDTVLPHSEITLPHIFLVTKRIF